MNEHKYKLKLPKIETVKLFLKSELGRINRKGYSIEVIHGCLNAYVKRAEAYGNLIERFSTHVMNAPKISKYVHSVRFRLKDPLHLADKLVRKCLDTKKPRKITSRTLFDLKKGITDLGAVRILHLHPKEWKNIHRYLTKKGNMPNGKLVEKIAYVKSEQINTYRGPGLFKRTEVEVSKNGYTSLHYVYETRDVNLGSMYFECQVRTIFEEGWGEIDHQMNYPYKANSIVGGYLASLNATTHTANEIASKLETLWEIPLFVPWDTELRLERSAEFVYCVTPDLSWVANHLSYFVKHVRESEGYFFYFIIKGDARTRQNISKVRDRLKNEGLLGTKVKLTRVPSDKRMIPVISDLLLLENATDLDSHKKECSVSIVGAPPQRSLKREERLDMVIKDKSAVERLREFFEDLKG